MSGAVEEMPVQGLAVGLKACHQALLHRYTGDMVIGAEKNLRGTFEVLHSVARMARAQLARPFVTHGWVVAHESPDTGCGGNEVDADAAAHAVADHRAAFSIDIASGLQIAPCA